MARRIILLATAMGILSLPAIAQIKAGNGQISGSLETNSIYYMKDKRMDETLEGKDHFGTNNYLKVDYSVGKFSAGILAEGYFPALNGYDPLLNGAGLTSKYVQWQDKNFSFLAGDVYDQFGSGLIFRSYEDRALGFNNSIEGVHASYNFGGYVKVKGMYGRPRYYMGHAGSWIRGADMSISLSDIVGWEKGIISIEGSYVNRFEALDKNTPVEGNEENQPIGPDFAQYLTSPNLNMYSGRLNFDYEGFSARFEYVDKGKDLTDTEDLESVHKGKAILAELGYNNKGFGILATFRQLEYMNTMGSLYNGNNLGNVINYLPALTRQYTYMLANLNPYIPNTNGETGGQIDAFYTLRNKDTRSKYWNFHINFSNFYATKDVSVEKYMTWMDINFDVERQWNKSLKTSILYSRQERNINKGYGPGTQISDIIVGDVTYKFNKKHSIRAEVQYLYDESKEKNEGDWVAALVEYNISPAWSFYASDMYNLGATEKKINYYNIGASYTKSRTRIQLSYGRNRAGYVCSGGVCRLTPAYTGFNLLLTTSF